MGVVLFGQIRLFFVVVSGGSHFKDRPILPEMHDFSELSLGSLVKFGFAALGPFSRSRSHIPIESMKLLVREIEKDSDRLVTFEHHFEHHFGATGNRL